MSRGSWLSWKIGGSSGQFDRSGPAGAVIVFIYRRRCGGGSSKLTSSIDAFQKLAAVTGRIKNALIDRTFPLCVG